MTSRREKDLVGKLNLKKEKAAAHSLSVALLNPARLFYSLSLLTDAAQLGFNYSFSFSLIFRLPRYSAKMMQLLYPVIFGEMALIILLLFRSPFRKFLIMGLDSLKRGKGPVVVTTVGATVFIVLMSSVYTIFDIQRREVDPGSINPTDQVLMTRNLLDASLMGFLLFLGLMIDRLHHYIRELRLLRKTMEATKNLGRGFESGRVDEIKAMGEEITALKNQVAALESECSAKTDAAAAAESRVEALKKQSEGLLMEYDRLLEDNQSLKSQLQEVDLVSDGKKNM